MAERMHINRGGAARLRLGIVLWIGECVDFDDATTGVGEVAVRISLP